MFWPHLGYKLILRKCAFFSLCLFITPSFRSLMSDVSKVIQLYAEQWEGNYNITQYVHQGSYQRRRSPFVAFYSSVYRGPSHFPSPLLCVTVFGQRCYSVTEQKWYLTGNFMSMLFWSAVCCIACECVGVWVCVRVAHGGHTVWGLWATERPAASYTGLSTGLPGGAQVT